MAPASIFSLSFVIYTGFTIPVKDMHPWFRWLNYLNPVGYAFESLMINEVSMPRTNMTTETDTISSMITSFPVRIMFHTVRATTMCCQMREFAQPRELTPEQTLLMAITT
jgi:hypothetical protein